MVALSKAWGPTAQRQMRACLTRTTPFPFDLAATTLCICLQGQREAQEGGGRARDALGRHRQRVYGGPQHARWI